MEKELQLLYQQVKREFMENVKMGVINPIHLHKFAYF